MTLPIQNNFPQQRQLRDSADIAKFVKDLVFQLHTRDQQIVQVVNGDIRGSAFTQSQNWTPVLKGTVTPGTYTYDHQVGWALRQGLFTDLWFDISWSAAGASAGNLYIELPYKVAASDQKPFIGVLQPSSLSYGVGYSDLVINAIPGTYRGEIWATGSGVATANLAVAASGALIGHVRYIGVQNE